MTKGKIIKITEEIITIGMDNGTIKEVRRCDLDFTPKLEDLVDVFEDKDQIIVTRRKETSNAANSTLERLEKQLLVFCFSGREFHALLV